MTSMNKLHRARMLYWTLGSIENLGSYYVSTLKEDIAQIDSI